MGSERAGPEQQSYHAALLDNVEDGVIATDAGDFRITAWNRGAERLYGFTADEVVGRPAREVASYPGDQARLKLERELLDNDRSRVEFTARRKDGSSVEVEVIAAAVRDARGEITGYLGIHRDITERKRAEDQLRHNASLLDNIDDALLATDPEFVLTAWNRGAERMFGWTAGEAVGRSLLELVPTGFSDDQMAVELSTLAERGRWRGAGTFYRKDGRGVEAEALTIALRSAEGRTTGYVCILRDITERLRNQRALDLRARQQALLADLTLRNIADGDLPALLDDSTVLVARTLELELTKIGQQLPGGGIDWRAAYGWSGGTSARASPSPADPRSLFGYALLAGEPVISVDVRADERFGISEEFAEQNPVSAVAVVIPGEAEPFGVLIAAARRRRTFNTEDVDFIKSVVNVIGVAVERTRLSERMDEARESLRLRIARDLHDDALRELTDALALAMLARSAAMQRDEVARWDAQIAALRRVAQHLRSAVYGLRLPAEEGRSFADLLIELVAVQAGLAGATRLWLAGGDAIPPGALGRRGVEVLRILREALTNARLHSGAGAIELDASASTAERLALVVSDNGEWLDRDRWRSIGRGAGIAGMLERADGLGGRLQIGHRPGGGTSVSLEVPRLAEVENQQRVPHNEPNT